MSVDRKKLFTEMEPVLVHRTMHIGEGWIKGKLAGWEGNRPVILWSEGTMEIIQSNESVVSFKKVRKKDVS